MSLLNRMCAAATLIFALGACSPHAALLSALVPDGTASMLLGNLQKVSDANRTRVAELERAGRWDDMARLAEQNTATDSSNADWWLILGYARSQAGAYPSASKAFGEVIRLEPDNETGWNLLAQSYRSAGDSQRAVNVLNNALLALRDAPLTLFILGESYSDLGRFNEARDAYEKALALEPEFSTAWFGLSRAYYKLGRTDDARQARTRLEKLDPQLAKRLDSATEVKGAAAR